MGKKLFLAVACILAFLCFWGEVVFGAEEIPSYQANDRNADDWYSAPKSKATGSDQKGAKTGQEIAEEEREKEKSRYLWLFNDESYMYSLDTKNSHWIGMPNLPQERIVDVWVRLDPLPVKGELYQSSEKYYMEHYYLRPKNQQIQFISELEISGRPANDITERPYHVKNWENLVPGSVEDEVYHRCMKIMSSSKYNKGSGEKMTFRDAVEEYLRISL